jgi:hypothetical protein
VARRFPAIKEIPAYGTNDLKKLLVTGMMIALAGCQTSKGEGEPSQAALDAGMSNTGQYPKIGRIPVPETSQLGPEGTAALRGNLANARASQNTGEPGPETYAEKLRRLRKLGLLHGNETLAEIEATAAANN